MPRLEDIIWMVQHKKTLEERSRKESFSCVRAGTSVKDSSVTIEQGGLAGLFSVLPAEAVCHPREHNHPIK